MTTRNPLASCRCRYAIASERHLAALSESEQKIRAIVNTAVDGIVTIDEQGTVESFNPAAERIFRCNADEVIGKSVNRLIPPPDAERHDEYIHRYLQTGESTVLGMGVKSSRSDKTTFPRWLAVSHVRLIGRHVFTGIVRDFTDRKRNIWNDSLGACQCNHPRRYPWCLCPGSEASE